MNCEFLDCKLGLCIVIWLICVLDKKGKVRIHKVFDFIAYDVTCVGGKIGFRIFSDFYDPLDSHYLRKS